MARASRANGDLASAINLYSSVVAIKPADPAVMLEFGDTLVDAGALDDAIEVYRTVEPGSTAWLGAQLGLQQAYLKLGEPEKSLPFADQALAVVSARPSCSGLPRGDTRYAWAARRKRKNRIAQFLRARRTTWRRATTWPCRWPLTGQFGEAEDIMASMAHSSTATPRIRQNLALIYGLAGDAEHAGALSRVDLDTTATDSNLRFFELARSAEQR
jgi:tetratricopeptide (TPR) repeat protein